MPPASTNFSSYGGSSGSAAELSGASAGSPPRPLTRLPRPRSRTASLALRSSTWLLSPSRNTAAEAMSSNVLPRISLPSLPGETQMAEPLACRHCSSGIPHSTFRGNGSRRRIPVMVLSATRLREARWSMTPSPSAPLIRLPSITLFSMTPWLSVLYSSLQSASTRGMPTTVESVSCRMRTELLSPKNLTRRTMIVLSRITLLRQLPSRLMYITIASGWPWYRLPAITFSSQSTAAGSPTSPGAGSSGVIWVAPPT
jgi:hypothetical protein